MGKYQSHEVLVIKIVPREDQTTMDDKGLINEDDYSGTIRRLRTTNIEEVLQGLVNFSEGVEGVSTKLSLHTIGASREITVEFDRTEHNPIAIAERTLNVAVWMNVPPARNYALSASVPESPVPLADSPAYGYGPGWMEAR